MGLAELSTAVIETPDERARRTSSRASSTSRSSRRTGSAGARSSNDAPIGVPWATARSGGLGHDPSADESNPQKVASQPPVTRSSRPLS
jgi:hypothetical protein